MQKPDWDHWRYFLAIARHRQLAVAARALGVNHTTVFRRLNAMEAQLGARLFERLPAGYQLTVAGETMLAAAQRVEQEIADAEMVLAGADLRPTGLIRVPTTEDLMVAFLQPHLAAFRAAYPGIELEVMSGNLLFDMTRREADVAIRPTDRPPEHLVGRNLGRLGWGLYGAGSYLRRYGTPTGETALAGHAIITVDETLAHIAPARWLAARIEQAQVVLRSGSLLIQQAAAREGMGLALLPCVVGDGERRLRRVLGPIEELSRAGCWLLTHPALRHVARVSAFMSFLAAAIEPQRERLAGER